jgi:hypothetical protein
MTAARSATLGVLIRVDHSRFTGAPTNGSFDQVVVDGSTTRMTKPRLGNGVGQQTRRRHRRRALSANRARVQEKVLHAMRPGEPMKKGAIMKAARLGEDDDVRVRNVLAKLKTAGVLTMKGLRGSATCTLKG